MRRSVATPLNPKPVTLTDKVFALSANAGICIDDSGDSWSDPAPTRGARRRPTSTAGATDPARSRSRSRCAEDSVASRAGCRAAAQ